MPVQLSVRFRVVLARDLLFSAEKYFEDNQQQQGH